MQLHSNPDGSYTLRIQGSVHDGARVLIEGEDDSTAESMRPLERGPRFFAFPTKELGTEAIVADASFACNLLTRQQKEHRARTIAAPLKWQEFHF